MLKSGTNTVTPKMESEFVLEQIINIFLLLPLWIKALGKKKTEEKTVV